MSTESKIEWTDATWNPVRGCTKVSPGCAHCYAEVFAERFRGVKGHPYEQGFDLRLVPEKLTEPLRWKKPRRVFVNSMSDLFQDGVPDDYIDQVFAVMALAPQHTFQVLTKRAARMRDYLSRHDIGLEWLVHLNMGTETLQDKWAYQEADAVRWTREGLPNVWLGVSVENQHFADERIPLLLQTPAAVRFISAEPLLGPVDIEPFLWDEDDRHDALCGLDWVIVGGESGHGARPFNIQWARDIVAQCKAAGVPVFVKQLGGNPHVRTANHYGKGVDAYPFNMRYQLKSRKGGDMLEWPEDLRVRQFPAEASR